MPSVCGCTLNQRFKINIPGRSEHHVVGSIPFQVVRRHGFTGNTTDGGIGSQNTMPQSIFCVIPLQQSFDEYPKRFIFVHGDFFENHLAFVFEVLTAQFGPEKGGKDGKAFKQPLGASMNPKCGCFSAGPGVVIQSQIVEGFVDGFTGQITRALEGHVFQKVTDTHQLRRLVTGTGIDKETARRRDSLGVNLGRDQQAVVKLVLAMDHAL